MNVGRPAVDGMERPATKPALFEDRLLDGMPLIGPQHDRLLAHEKTRVMSKSGTRFLQQTVIIDPAASVAGEP